MDRSEGVQTATASPPEAPASAPLFAIPLPPWDMYTVFVSLVSGYLLIPILVSNVLQITYPFITPAGQIWAEQATTVFTWFAIFGFLAWRYRVNLWHYLGLEWNRPARYYLWQSTLVLLMLVTLMVLYNLALRYLLGAKPDNPYDAFTSNEVVVITVFAVLSAPILEELIFRGLVQGTFHKVAPPVRAMLSTCLVFLLVHGNYFAVPHALVYVFVVSLVLGYWRERTQSLIPGMAGHLFNNVIASAMLLWGLAQHR